MIAPFTTVKTSTLSAKAGEFRISDLMFDPETFSVDYAVLDGGGWVTNTDVLLHANRLDAFVSDDMTWHARMNEGDLAQAPRIGGDNVVDLSALPPVIVGPFGMTYSPILMAAQMLGYPVTKITTTQHAEDQQERISEWMGAVVFSAEGPIARIVNLHVETETMRVMEAELAIGAEIFILPITALHSLVSGDGYAVCDLSDSEIKQGFTEAEPGPTLPVMPCNCWVQRAA